MSGTSSQEANVGFTGAPPAGGQHRDEGPTLPSLSQGVPTGQEEGSMWKRPTGQVRRVAGREKDKG